MAASDDTGQRKGRFAPYGLLSPGIIWLLLFFLVPMWTLLRIALSHKPNPYLPNYVFAWRWSNFGDAVDRFRPELLRSFEYAAIATVFCILIGYPLAYYIAVKGGRWKNLLLGLVIVPFFTSFLIRTIAWQTILGSNGFIVTSIHDLHLTGAADAIGLTTHGAILNTPQAVIGGLTYNFIPFMILPIYVSLEKIDPALLEAARDLYSTPARAFWRVVLPLSLPGVFAGTLLTFIPAAGDFINAELLGNTNTRMIGTTVSQLFLAESDYPTAAALSFIFMAIITIAVLIYAKVLGTDELST
jgi:spermidine/putrescine transport system permease protein